MWELGQVSGDDGQLVSQVLEGRAEAFRTLVERHHARAFRLAFGMLGHRQDAEDTVQEAFLRAYRSLARFDTKRSLSAWLAGIVVNCCRDHATRRKRFPVVSEAIRDAPARPDGGSDDELVEALDQAVGELRPEYRAVFVMFHREHLAYETIAEALGKPEGTIKTWLHRARNELMERLQRRGLLPVEDKR